MGLLSLIQFDFALNILILAYYLILPCKGRVQIRKGCKKPAAYQPQVFLYFYFRPVLKGETDIFLIENCDIVNQGIPEVFIKF